MFDLTILRRGLAAAGLFAAAGVAAAASISSFGVMLMPDTQFYSRYATAAEGSQFMNRYGSEPYATQTAWLAQHAKTLGIPFIVHLGDVVDQQDKSAQWVVADAAMKTLETAQVPYSILAGNHDVTNGCGFSGVQTDCTDAQRNLAAEPYLQWFGKSRAQAQGTFVARDPSGFHEAHIFTTPQDHKVMSLALSWRISDAALQWARGVIAAHPTVPVIVSSHELLAIDSDAVTARETDYSKFLWERLIKDNDQIFMVVSGHNHGSAQMTKTNIYGNTVLQLVADYQMAYQGGNGYLQMLEFDLTANKIKALSFSPWVPIKPKPSLNQFDRAVLTEPNNQFTFDINFRQRFARFNPSFSAGTPNRDVPLVETVRSMILANYQDPAAPDLTKPFDSEDYPHHPATISHWRFGGTPGEAIQPGTVVADRKGQSPMKRAALSGSSVVADASWSAERHAQSANPGSVCLRPGSHFLTEVTAPLNAELLKDGYTVEAIVKMDKQWSAANNAWMTVMSRGGKRSSLPGWTGSYGDSSPLQFAVSNLREFQWEVTTMPAANRLQSKTNWSGEVMVDEWEHVAIVNDPVTRDSTMYVAGAPVLRNVQSAIGIAGAAHQPWVVGGVVNGASGGGFFGCVSEVRITRAALKPGEWLTARKNRVLGTGGRQTLVGTAGDDMIAGNQAADTLTGGAGADTFVFTSLRDGPDTITDFTPGEDRINLQGVLKEIGFSGANPLAAGVLRFADSAQGAVLQVNGRTLAILRGLTAAQLQSRTDLLAQ